MLSQLTARGSHGRGDMKKAATIVVPLHYGFRNAAANADENKALSLKLKARSAFVYKVGLRQQNELPNDLCGPNRIQITEPV